MGWPAEEILRTLQDNGAVKQALKAVPEAAYVVLLIELDTLREWLDACYRGWGRPPWDPVVMLRTFLLMSACQVTSINKWQNKLRNNIVLRALSGFEESDGVPGVSTFYDYMNRLLDGPPPKVEGVKWVRPSERLSRSFRRDLKAEKEARTKGTVDETAQRALAFLDQLEAQPKSALLGSFGERMQVLLRFAVQESVARGLFRTANGVALSVDGSLVESQASKKGIPEPDLADGVRVFSDPTATFARKRDDPWVFGYKLHAAAIKVGKVELPVALSVAPAHTADCMMAAMDTVSAKFALKGLKITALLGDAGYDSSAMFGFARTLNMHPIIALKAPIITQDNVSRDTQSGQPLCPAGLVMRCHGRQGDKIVFNCPVRRPNHDGQIIDHVEECPWGKLCDPESKMGPYLRLQIADSPKANLLIYPGTPRWKRLYSERTAVERIFSRLKVAGHLGARPYRRMHVFHFVAVCQSMVMHMRAWAKQLGGLVKPKTVAEMYALVDRLMEGRRQPA